MSRGGQEVAATTMMSTLAYHGMIYVPMGTKGAMKLMKNIDEVHSSSPKGAGSISGERIPTNLELEIASIQGENFWKTLSRVNFEQ
jgi:NAD(P)H dehydrogenase (quinone)